MWAPANGIGQPTHSAVTVDGAKGSNNPPSPASTMLRLTSARTRMLAERIQEEREYTHNNLAAILDSLASAHHVNAWTRAQ